MTVSTHHRRPPAPVPDRRRERLFILLLALVVSAGIEAGAMAIDSPTMAVVGIWALVAVTCVTSY